MMTFLNEFILAEPCREISLLGNRIGYRLHRSDMLRGDEHHFLIYDPTSDRLWLLVRGGLKGSDPVATITRLEEIATIIWPAGPDHLRLVCERLRRYHNLEVVGAAINRILDPARRDN